MLRVERQGAVLVMRGSQPLAGEAVELAAQAMQTSLSKGQPMAVLDLAGVPLIDSKGLELLVEQQEHCARRGGTLKIAAANALCRDILRCTDLAQRFEMFADVKSAVGSFVK